MPVVVKTASGAAAHKVTPPRIDALTSLRFFAALHVVLYHTLPRARDGFGRVVANFLDLGFTAVGLFFVLSGFILATVYREVRSEDRLRFWLARFARIYPLYALSLLLDVPRLLAWRMAKYGLLLGAAGTSVTLAGQLAMLQAWVPVRGGLNYPSWSLSTEAFFYLMFPVALGLSARLRSLKVAAGAVVIIFAGMLVLQTYLATTLSELPSTLETVLTRNPLLRLPEFCAGMLLATVHRGVSARIVREDRQSLVGRGCLVLGMAGLAAVVMVGHRIPTDPLKTALVTPLYGTLILGLAVERGAFTRWMSSSPLIMLGDASYAVYLLHALVFDAFKAVGGRAGSVHYLAYLGCVIGLSILAYKYVERPARARILSLRDRRASGVSRSPDISLHAGAEGAECGSSKTL